MAQAAAKPAPITRRRITATTPRFQTVEATVVAAEHEAVVTDNRAVGRPTELPPKKANNHQTRERRPATRPKQQKLRKASK